MDTCYICGQNSCYPCYYCKKSTCRDCFNRYMTCLFCRIERHYKLDIYDQKKLETIYSLGGHQFLKAQEEIGNLLKS